MKIEIGNIIKYRIVVIISQELWDKVREVEIFTAAFTVNTVCNLQCNRNLLVEGFGLCCLLVRFIDSFNQRVMNSDSGQCTALILALYISSRFFNSSVLLQ